MNCSFCRHEIPDGTQIVCDRCGAVNVDLDQADPDIPVFLTSGFVSAFSGATVTRRYAYRTTSRGNRAQP